MANRISPNTDQQAGAAVLPDAGAAWRYRFAVLTAAATFALIVIGGGVTSSDVGMADTEWPTPPWYLLVVSSLERGLGFFVEHSHRAWGYLVGLLSMVLCGWFWLAEPRRWMRWLGTLALAGVVIQGVLGGMRVLLNIQAGSELAFIHGCLAQAIFALMCSIAVFSSPRWSEIGATTFESIGPLRRIGTITTLLVYGQLVLGAALRHVGSGMFLVLHVVLAVAVAVHAVLLAQRVLSSRALNCLGAGWARALLTLTALQLLLGIAAWGTTNGFGKYAWQPASSMHVLLATTHVAVGSLILVSSLALTLKSLRGWQPAATDLPLTIAATAEGAQ